MNEQNRKYTQVLSESIKLQYENKKAKKDFDGDGKIETPEKEYKDSKKKAITKAVAKQKSEGYAAVIECLDKETFTVDTQEGPKEVPVDRRGISNLDKSVGKAASEIAIDNTAKAKKDPDPKSMKSDKEKGKAAGDSK